MTFTVDCPGCGRKVEWSESNPFRPFCSGRCKDADFIGWAEEKNVITGSSEGVDFPGDADS